MTTGASVHQQADRPRAVVEVVDGDVEVATVDIAGDVPGLFVVAIAARVQVAARQLGWSARLREPSDRVAAALEISGLAEQLGVGSGAQLRRQPEGREDGGGVEEVVQPDQPAT